jgi:hypothetical protein
MNEDGSDIHQVSFNQSHDLDPTVMSDGRIAFARWDHMGGNNAIDVFTMNPDGTGLELLYGVNSHDTGTGGATIQFLQPREMPEGGLVAIIRPFTVDNFGGDIITIDTPNYIENTQPTVTNQGVLSGPAQAPAVINDVRTDGTIRYHRVAYSVTFTRYGMAPIASSSAGASVDSLNSATSCRSSCRARRSGLLIRTRSRHNPYTESGFMILATIRNSLATIRNSRC